LLDAAGGEERGFFDALGRTLFLDKSDAKEESDKRSGRTSHAAMTDAAEGLVSGATADC